jgi:hypothetical protein
MATIVTSYFHLEKSKATHETYLEWMKNMLIINNPMVIFCDEENVEHIRELRKDKEEITQVISCEFIDFYSYRYYHYFLQSQQHDTEMSKGHNMFLYMIWAEKSNFLKRAIEMNPFATDYFLWVDIGCFRKKNTEYLDWPNPKRISEMPSNKVLLLSVIPFTDSELSIEDINELPSFQYTNRIGAPIFGGGKEILLEWHTKYYEMLENFIVSGRFIGKDQSIMNSVYLLNKDKCELVQWKQPCHDIWFYLQDYLHH